MLLPAVVLAFLAGSWGVGAVTAQMRCVDAAREVARAIARGEQPGDARGLAGMLAPGSARVEVSEGEGLVRVTVRAPIRLPGTLGRVWPAVEVSGSATTVAEP